MDIKCKETEECYKKTRFRLDLDPIIYMYNIILTVIL